MLTDDELVIRAKSGEVIGNGSKQIALLCERLQTALDVLYDAQMCEAKLEGDLRVVAGWAINPHCEKLGGWNPLFTEGSSIHEILKPWT
jgi:hypothetical protein